MILWNKK